MLSGKAIFCALRGFLLVDGALECSFVREPYARCLIAYALADPWGDAKGAIAPSPYHQTACKTCFTRHNFLGFKLHSVNFNALQYKNQQRLGLCLGPGPH